MNENTDIMALINHDDMDTYKGHVRTAIETIMGAKTSHMYVESYMALLDSDKETGMRLCDAIIGLYYLIENSLIPSYDQKMCIYVTRLILNYAPKGVMRPISHLFIKNDVPDKRLEEFIDMLPQAISIYTRYQGLMNNDCMMIQQQTLCMSRIGNLVRYQMKKMDTGYALNNDIDYFLGHLDNSDRYSTKFHNLEIIIKHSDITTARALLTLFFASIDSHDYNEEGMDICINGTTDALTDIFISGADDIDIPTESFNDILYLGRISCSTYDFCTRFVQWSIDNKNKGKSCVPLYRLYDFILTVFSGSDWKSQQEIMNMECLSDFFSLTRRNIEQMPSLRKCYNLYSHGKASHEFIREMMYME